MYKTLLLLYSFLTATTSFTQEIDVRSYMLYNKLIQATTEYGDTSKRIVLLRETQENEDGYTGIFFEKLHDKQNQIVVDTSLKMNVFDTAYVSLLDKFNNRKRSSQVFDQKFFGPRVIMASKDSVMRILKGGSEEKFNAFFQRYPGTTGLVHFSKIVFNNAGNKAVLFTQFFSRHDQWDAKFVIFEIKNGDWVHAFDIYP